ncbi:MAG: response regulator [Campylobacterales bacterium]|nr:response regulator [Campylobacterales bacterium]
MKIVIIENEVYLAQSIASKLMEKNFEVELFSSVKEASEREADVYLLSTNLQGQSINSLIEKHKEKIIILMVNYINNDTVSEPIKLGAKDYIVKPFMIEELLRKIEHFREFQALKKENRLCQDYIKNIFSNIEYNYDIDKLQTPCIITTNYLRLADKMVFDFAYKNSLLLTMISPKEKNYKDLITKQASNNLIYFTDFDKLKKRDQEEVLMLLKAHNFIITTSSDIESEYKNIKLISEDKLYSQNEILTIDDYVKFVINNFQYQFPDTELSKKLGISRKSLWEKRKKYDLYKKK